jgi:hypothetical protein
MSAPKRFLGHTADDSGSEASLISVQYNANRIIGYNSFHNFGFHASVRYSITHLMQTEGTVADIDRY